MGERDRVGGGDGDGERFHARLLNAIMDGQIAPVNPRPGLQRGEEAIEEVALVGVV